MTGDDEILLRVAGDSRDPLDEVTDRELQGEIQKAIDALPKRQRSVAKLRLLEGLGYKEITKQIGGSVQTVKSLFSVARKTLRVKTILYKWLRSFVSKLACGRIESLYIHGYISLRNHLISGSFDRCSCPNLRFDGWDWRKRLNYITDDKCCHDREFGGYSSPFTNWRE